MGSVRFGNPVRGLNASADEAGVALAQWERPPNKENVPIVYDVRVLCEQVLLVFPVFSCAMQTIERVRFVLHESSKLFV